MNRDDFKPGTEYRWLGKLYHVRAIVDDDYMVVRKWSRRRQRWDYTVEDMDVMAIMLTKRTQDGAQ